MKMAPKHEQLFACAKWNHAESVRALLALKSEKNPAEKAYLIRRAARLSAQANSLFAQAHDEDRDDFYASIWTDPSMYACEGQQTERA